MLQIIILAAGKGTRMRSNTPKVLHTLAAKPFVQHVLDRATDLGAASTYIVTGHGAEQVEQALANSGAAFVAQTEQLGTGHAVQQVLPHIQPEASVLILYGDVPLTKTETLSNLLMLVSSESMGLLTVNLAEPSGYGRILRDANEQVTAIVEQKDAGLEQLAIQEVNTGVMAVKGKHLLAWLPQLSNSNAQGEYYLTDIIAMACAAGIEVKTAQPRSEAEVMGVNDRIQQAQLERIYQREQAEALLTAGVTLLDPARFDCRGTLTAGSDCVIDINCIFEGDVTLGDNVTIGANCSIKNAKIGDNTDIKANTIIEDSTIAGGSDIGPFARLRPGTELALGAKIGNFVETKKVHIGAGSKVNHLSYVGDAVVGKGVNIGAGTITCNYDGVNKHQTTIEDDVFVGSNTALVAPVTVAKGSTIGAGSTVTQSSKDHQLVVARAKQRNIDNWRRPVKNPPSKK